MNSAGERRHGSAGQASPPSATDQARYPGPPVGAAPTPDWHPVWEDPVVAPRRLPDLDREAMDLAEHRATQVTYGIAAAAALVLSLAVWLRSLP